MRPFPDRGLFTMTYVHALYCRVTSVNIAVARSVLIVTCLSMKQSTPVLVVRRLDKPAPTADSRAVFVQRDLFEKFHRYPYSSISYGDRTFAAAGPRLWNSLPVQLRNPDITYRQFRRQLKGHLFGNHGHVAP